MPTSIFEEAMRAELAGDPLDWPSLSEPCLSEPSLSEPADADTLDGPSYAAGRPRAEVKCPEIRLQPLGEIGSEPTAWLSPDRCPLGTLSVLAGPSGAGKTFLALDLVAQVTRGAPWPSMCPGKEKSGDESPRSKIGAAARAGSVVVMSAKDSTTQVLRPRLDAAGADVARVTIISPAQQGALFAAKNSNLGPLARRLNALQAAIVDAGDCRLAVVDDLDAWMGEFGLSSPALHVCVFLDQLAELAARTQTAIVCLARLNATPEGRIAYRELTNPLKSAQVVWLVASDHDDLGRKLLLPVKNNLAPQTSGLGFRLAPATSGAATVVWEEVPLSVTAAEVMAPRAGWVERRRDQDVAAEWLLAALDGGRIASSDLFRQAAECGIAVKTLRRAAAQLGIKPKKEAFQGSWYWSVASEREGEMNDEGSRGDAEKRRCGDAEMTSSRVTTKDEDGQLSRQSSHADIAAVNGRKSDADRRRATDVAEDGQGGVRNARDPHEFRYARRIRPRWRR